MWLSSQHCQQSTQLPADSQQWGLYIFSGTSQLAEQAEQLIVFLSVSCATACTGCGSAAVQPQWAHYTGG